MGKQELIEMLFTMIGGSSGAGIIVATIVGVIKTVWKPKAKQLYWIPAGVLSLGASVGLMWYVDLAIWTVGGVATLLVLSTYTALYQLMANNEAWEENIKPVVIKILVKLFGGKK